MSAANVTMGCPRCGQPVGLFAWRCEACGTPAVDAAPAPPAPAPAPATKACTACGMANPAVSRFCGGCGGPFSA